MKKGTLDDFDVSYPLLFVSDNTPEIEFITEPVAAENRFGRDCYRTTVYVPKTESHRTLELTTTQTQSLVNELKARGIWLKELLKTRWCVSRYKEGQNYVYTWIPVEHLEIDDKGDIKTKNPTPSKLK